MMRVAGIDHLVIRVSDYDRSKEFYGKLFDFFGFEVSDEYGDAIGWTNGKTRFWIGERTAQEARRRKAKARAKAADQAKRRSAPTRKKRS